MIKILELKCTCCDIIDRNKLFKTPFILRAPYPGSFLTDNVNGGRTHQYLAI